MKKITCIVAIAVLMTASVYAEPVEKPERLGVVGATVSIVKGFGNGVLTVMDKIISIKDGVLMVGYYRSKGSEMAVIKLDMRKETEIKADKL